MKCTQYCLGFGDGSSIVIAITPNNQTENDNATLSASSDTTSPTLANDSSSKNKLKTSDSSKTAPAFILLAMLSLISLRFVA